MTPGPMLLPHVDMLARQFRERGLDGPADVCVAASREIRRLRRDLEDAQAEVRRLTNTAHGWGRPHGPVPARDLPDEAVTPEAIIRQENTAHGAPRRVTGGW